MTIKGWQLALVCLLGGGGAIISETCMIAQSIPDTTPDRNLGTTSQPFDAQIDIIRGGTRPNNGSNLFHSFQEFSVQAGHAIYFANPAGVQNILSRVTGGNRSNIQGTVGVLGPANLFLINPSGIIFGPNAALDVRGSFIATTANAIQLGQTGFFSASAPASSNLLEVTPSAFFFNALQTQPIINQAVLGTVYTTGQLVQGLAVPMGHSLLLVGGDVQLEGGIIQARGGRVELSGLSGPGAIGLTQTDNVFQLNIPVDAPLANVRLTNSSTNPSTPSIVYVAARGGGSIAINAYNLDILDESYLEAGVQAGLGTTTSQAGDITLNAAGAFRASGDGGVFNIVQAGAAGNAGNIIVNADSFTVNKGALLGSYTFGQGDTGNVSITARNAAIFDGVGSNGLSSGISNQVSSSAVGKGGKLTLSAGSLTVINGAKLRSTTFGRGDAGDISITVRDAATFDAVGSNGSSSGIGSQVSSSAIGKGGKLTLSAGSLTVTNGAELTSDTFGHGDAGDILITVRDIATFDGVGSNGLSSNVSTEVKKSAVGQAGKITISAETLSVTGGAQISASTLGQGNGGDVTIIARDTTRFDGASSKGSLSAVISEVGSQGKGKGGNVNISTGSLFVTNGALIGTSTSGQGDGGSITINARDTATFDGISSSGVSSAAASQVATFNAVGKGGNIKIDTRSLFVTGGAQLAVGTFGDGDGGNVTINAFKSITLDGVGSNGGSSGVFSNVERGSLGKGGEISIKTALLSITNRATLSSNSFSLGRAGDISVSADSIRLDNQGVISTSTTLGDGGNITLNARNLVLLRHNSNISTNVSSSFEDLLFALLLLVVKRIPKAIFAGDSGNITINSPFIVAIPDENSDITANAFRGNGGRVNIATKGVFALQFRPQLTPLSDITASSQFGISGIVAINSPDTSFLQNSLTQFPQTLINTTRLLANSCIVRRDQQNGSFLITGSGGLPDRPDNPSASPFPTGEVRSVDGDREETTTQNSELNTQNSPERPWKIGDPIAEPQGVYQLPDGQLVMSRECDK